MITACSSSPLSSPAASAAPDRETLLADLDRSLRFPVLALLMSSLAWLVVGSVGLLMAAVKLHAPGMLAQCAHLTYGRLHPAAMNALVFGFASQAGLAVALWMLSRLGRTRLAYPGFAIIGWFFWNLALPIGLVGILLGDTTGFAWFELPHYATPVLFVAYALLGLVALVTFARRTEKDLYVSHWYLLGALFWFPWIYSVAQWLLVVHPPRGVVQAAVHGWAANGLVTLWLTPLGLAIIFYFLPKITGRPLYSRSLAQVGFWTLALFGAWGGLHAGAPLPAAFVSASVAASVLMIVPVLCVGVNWRQTLLGQLGTVKQSRPLQFICAAGASYLLAALLGIVGSIRGVSQVTDFTYFTTAQTVLLIFGFLGLAVAGAVYYLVPRLVQAEFPCSVSTRVHWYGSVAGLAIATLALVIGGLVQGFGMHNADRNYLEVVKSTKPWLHVHALGMTLIALGNGAFLFNFTLLLVQKLRQCLPGCCGLPAVRPAATKARITTQATSANLPRMQPRPQQPPRPQQGSGKKRKRR